MTARSLLLISLFCLITGSVYGQKKKKRLSIYDQIEQYIVAVKSSHNIENGDLLISIIDSSGTKNLSSFNDSGKQEQPTDLIFELGDLTQIFTSLLVHELASAGKLDLEISINSLLPIEFQSVYFQKVTLQDCLSHTTGLPRLPNNLGAKQLDHNQPFEYYQPSDLVSFLKVWQPSNKERKYQYSMIGYELVGIILTHQFQKSYEQLIQEILKPNYGFKTLTTEMSPSLTKGKNKVGNTVEPMRFASFLASSGLKSSRKDLERLLTNTQCLSRISFLESLIVQAPTDVDPSVSIASGWHYYKVNRHHNFYLHKGSTAGFSSFMAYNPTSKTGVIILSSKKVNLGPLGYYIMGQLNNRWKR